MRTFTVKEVREFFRSCGVKASESLVQEWMEDKNTIITGHQIDEEDLYRFNDWHRRKGPTYRMGINDRTKIARLLEGNTELERKIETLKEAKKDLEGYIENLF